MKDSKLWIDVQAALMLYLIGGLEALKPKGKFKLNNLIIKIFHQIDSCNKKTKKKKIKHYLKENKDIKGKRGTILNFIEISQGNIEQSKRDKSVPTTQSAHTFRTMETGCCHHKCYYNVCLGDQCY